MSGSYEIRRDGRDSNGSKTMFNSSKFNYCFGKTTEALRTKTINGEMSAVIEIEQCNKHKVYTRI